MRRTIFIIFTALLFTCCQSSRFIHIDQSCLNASDHGEVQLFFGNDSCGYFKKTIKKFKKTDFIKNSQETMTLKSSALVINKNYYNQLEYILKKYTETKPKDCAVFYKIYNSRKKVISESYVSKSDYANLKNEIRKLNVQYKVDKENVARIEWYFSIVDFDNGIK